MATIPITSLPEASSVNENDQLIVQGSSSTQRATVARVIRAVVDKFLATEGKAADAKAVGDALKGKLDKTGGEMAGYLDFKQTSTGLRWTLANGDRFDFRPWSPTNVFQLTRTVAGAAIAEYGVINVDENGTISFDVPINGVGTHKLIISTDGIHADLIGTAEKAKNGITASGDGYARFGSGLQICWTLSPLGGSSNTVWTYPAAFASIPSVSYQAFGGNPAIMDVAVGGTATATAATCYGMRNAGGNFAAYGIRAIAIGQWK